MRILICGGTGVIGRYVVPLLVARGHEVTALARDDQAAALAESMGARIVRGDLFAPGTLVAASAGQDAIVHAATSLPRTFPGKPSEFATNDRIRREGTMNLLAAARAAGVRRIVVQSIVWVHGDTRGAWIAEDAPLKPLPLARSAVEMEHRAREFARETGAAVQILRCSALYAAEAWHTREIIERLRRRLAPIIGNGENYQCFVHGADVALAFALATETDQRGDTYFITDDEPVHLGEYLRWLARAAGTPEPLRIPVFMARLGLGQEMLEAYSASFRCRNDRIKRALGWFPRYPTFREGYAEVLPRMAVRA